MMASMMTPQMPMMMPVQNSFQMLQMPNNAYVTGGNQMIPQQVVQQPQQPAMVQQPQGKDLNWIKMNLENFPKMNPKDIENAFGTLLYPLILKIVSNTDLCAKITGMLIEPGVLEHTELIELLENPQTLRARINEAREIINESNK